MFRSRIDLLSAAALGPAAAALVLLAASGCDGGATPDASPAAVDDHAGHDHAEGEGHDDGEHEGEGGAMDHDHGDEVSLGTVRIGDFDVEAWQGHGELAAGKELHLVVKLSPDDRGRSVVRTWIGTEDPLASIVGRADYAAADGEHEVHVTAPDPLPIDARWWIEIETPDGERLVGSIAAH
jgi:hypothetical protein